MYYQNYAPTSKIIYSQAPISPSFNGYLNAPLPTPSSITRPLFLSFPPRTTFQNHSPAVVNDYHKNTMMTPQKPTFSGLNFKESPFKITKSESSTNFNYEGEFLNGLKHGFGKLKKDQTEIYIGEWEEDFFNGSGILVNPAKISPSIENENKDINYENVKKVENAWIKYEGEFKKGKMNGFGTIYFENGDRYRGFFKEGLIYGEGSYYKEMDNHWMTGKWNYNKLVCLL